MKNILVTGGAGFIGSAFVRYMTQRYPDYNIVVYDKMTYAGNMDNLLLVHDEPNFRFERGDIASRAGVARVLAEHQIDTIVNFAAESHVDRSILDADAFLHTNSIGVYILLDEGRKHGIGRFLQVSTDEVYGSVPVGFSVENSPLAPRNPYSAAKAGGELMARAYFETYRMDVLITRGSNTFGPYQYPEKLLPLFITEAIDDRRLPVYGDGRQIRDWLYVEDHVSGIDAVLHHGASGEAYNLAGEDLRHNIDVVRAMLERLGKPGTLIQHVPDREGHDLRYAMSSEKAAALGWQRRFTFDVGLAETVRWYAANEWWWRKIKTGEYLEYYKRQYAARLAATEE
ncbi:MAG: dTDP-glucose 4,6-dehydratase [Anaerolineae bacterium]|nr:dTDP-glucose 4,6-dehydratase [Anaerolineae bacterium]NUQ03279.1 dTDP-glucose 4,6-dehydratase [Anaerolineae bacterium]